MTCIVGVADQGTVWLGGDSLTSDGNDNATIVTFSKVWKSGGCICGTSGSVRFGQVLRGLEFGLDLVDQDAALDAVAFELVPRISEHLEQAGFKPRKAPGDLLVGVAGRLFLIDCGLGVTERAEGFDAIGSGAEYALGCLFENEDWTLDPLYRVQRALECAQRFTTTVREPFSISHLEPSWAFLASTPEALAST